MATIVQKRYTIADARNKREPQEYAGIILRVAKSAKLGTAGHIIMLIYNGLELKFQRDIRMPSLDTLLEAFLKKLDDHKDILWGLVTQSNCLFGQPFNNLYYATPFSRSSNPYYNRGQSCFNNPYATKNQQAPWKENFF